MRGACICKRVHYETSGEPFDISYCHCQSCRKNNGAPVVVLAGYKHEQVRFSGVERKFFESSPGVKRAFCEHCGTPLTWEGDGGELGQIIELHISTFDEPDKMVPRAHAFAPERISWFDVADELPRYEGFVERSTILHHGPAATSSTINEE